LTVQNRLQSIAPEYIGWPQGKIARQPKVVDATGRLGEGYNLFGTL
jgi:hypothetical protein